MSTHFSERTFDFLAELAENNNRDWFAANKGRYEAEVREPALAFVRAVGERLPGFAPHFVADDRKMGGSLMRVFRDTRFSKDKTPYKTNIGIHFRHEAGRDVHAPGYYVHIAPGECFVAAGIWHPPGDALAMIRRRIDEEPVEWLGVRDDAVLERWFRLAGDSLKTTPKGYTREHPLIEDLRRKDFIAVADMAPPLVEQGDFAEIACDYFEAAGSLVGFLCRSLRLVV